MTSFKYILLNIVAFIAFCNCIKDKFLLKLFLANVGILTSHYLICIFLESEFNNKYLQKNQVLLEKRIYFISLIATISLYINWFLLLLFFRDFLLYKKFIPFLINNFDNSIHYKKRCDLYNVNEDDDYPYKYICSYNAGINEFPINLLFNEDSFSSSIKCFKNDYLINNNNVINSFINEYYKEDIYYCDLKMLPYQFSKINPKEDNYEITICPFLLITAYMYLFVKYSILIHTYFNNIKPNINIDVTYY